MKKFIYDVLTGITCALLGLALIFVIMMRHANADVPAILALASAHSEAAISLTVETTFAWFIASLVLAEIVLDLAFFYCMSVAGCMEAGLWLPWSVTALARVLYYPGGAADVYFNLFKGRFVFRELAQHGATFSNRIQWHIDNSTGRRLAVALDYALFLNRIRPDHIKRVPS